MSLFNRAHFNLQQMTKTRKQKCYIIKGVLKTVLKRESINNERCKHPEVASYSPPAARNKHLFPRFTEAITNLSLSRRRDSAGGGGKEGSSISEPRVPSSVNDRIRCYCSSSDARCEERDNKSRLGRGVGHEREKGRKNGRKGRGKERKNGDFVIAHFLLRCH